MKVKYWKYLYNANINKFDILIFGSYFKARNISSDSKVWGFGFFFFNKRINLCENVPILSLHLSNYTVLKYINQVLTELKRETKSQSFGRYSCISYSMLGTGAWG